MTRQSAAPEKRPVLLDTHVWIWFVLGDKTLGKKAVNMIIEASKKSSLLLSCISLWETAMLESKGRLVIARDICSWMEEALTLPGLSVEPITAKIAIDSTRLPEDFHADPADKIIVATARHKNAALITRDAEILRYAERKHLQCVQA